MDCDAGIRTTAGEYSFDLAGEEKKSEAVTKDILETIQNDLFDILQKEDTDIDTKIANIKAYLVDTKAQSSQTNNDTDSAQVSTESVSLNSLIKIAEFVKDQYYTMSDYCKAFLQIAGSDDPSSTFNSNNDRLHDLFPDLDRWICKMFVNDIFYTQFPYIGEELSMSQAGTLLECEIRLLQVLLYSNVNVISNKDDLVDLCMYFFRMADFTPFSHNALVLMKK